MIAVKIFVVSTDVVVDWLYVLTFSSCFMMITAGKVFVTAGTLCAKASIVVVIGLSDALIMVKPLAIVGVDFAEIFESFDSEVDLPVGVELASDDLLEVEVGVEDEEEEEDDAAAEAAEAKATRAKIHLIYIMVTSVVCYFRMGKNGFVGGRCIRNPIRLLENDVHS